MVFYLFKKTIRDRKSAFFFSSVTSQYCFVSSHSDWLCPDVSARFSILVLIGQFDHVGYRRMTGSDTTAHALWAHYCGKSKTSLMYALTSDLTMNRPPSSTST